MLTLIILCLFKKDFFVFRVCPDPDVTFFLYTQRNPENPENITIGINSGESNLNETSFDPSKPSKIIIHGYNSDMYLNVLVEIRKGKHYSLLFRTFFSVIGH